MRSFLTSKPIESTTQEINIYTPSAPTGEMKEYMDYMAGLPYMKDRIDKTTYESPKEQDVDFDFKKIGNTPTAPQDNTKPKLKKPILDEVGVKRIIESIDGLGLEKDDADYLIKLAERESGYNPRARQGSFKGLYQFNKDSLKTVQINEDEYDSDVVKQHEAALKYKYYNLKILKPYFKFIGQSIKGIPITANGLAAAAHLLGAGTVKDFFDGTKKSERAKAGFKDALGTSILDYFALFG